MLRKSRLFALTFRHQSKVKRCTCNNRSKICCSSQRWWVRWSKCRTKKIFGHPHRPTSV